MTVPMSAGYRTNYRAMPSYLFAVLHCQKKLVVFELSYLYFTAEPSIKKINYTSSRQQTCWLIKSECNCRLLGQSCLIFFFGHQRHFHIQSQPLGPFRQSAVNTALPERPDNSSFYPSSVGKARQFSRFFRALSERSEKFQLILSTVFFFI